jgi:hypothetical protein
MSDGKAKAAPKKSARKRIPKGAVPLGGDKLPVMGRPSVYEPAFAERAEGLCMLGFTNEELGVAFGVNVTTITDWLRDRADFSSAVYAGRDGADEKVARALFKRAVGYEHPEDDIRTIALGNNQGSQIEITPTIKRYAPDTGAAQLWLHNRQRKRWKSSDDNTNLDPATVAALMRELAKATEDDVDA